MEVRKIISLLLVLLILIIIIIGFGAYNISATEKHWKITERIIAWVRDSSIKARSRDLEVPSLDNGLLLQGAEHYHAMCTICHLAPGIEPTELSTGLYPQAPLFHHRESIIDQEKKLDLARAYFWVIKNGIKMSAMPAWGLTHTDNVIWGMAAFILKMSNMTPDQYEAIVSSTRNSTTHDTDEHSHSHN